MSLDFLSGLLLTLAALAIIGYIVVTLVSTRSTDSRGASNLAETLAKYVQSEAKPVNAHLIGATGRVVAHSGDSSRPMRIRIGAELWPARLETSEAELPVGTSVAIRAIDGPVMIVEAQHAPADESP